MKTGTSYLQSLLGKNQDAMAAAGFDFLGGKFGVQARAVRDLLNLPRTPVRNRRGWQAIAEDAHRLDGRTGIVSMEFLSFASDRHVAEFLTPLEGLEVEVVMTVRDQFRTIPAQWQTYTRNFGTEDWGSYLRSIEPSRLRSRSSSRAHMTFHRAQDLLPALERWSAAPQVTRTHVVTVPAPGAPREELWDRFRAACGIPEVAIDLAQVHDNPSLGYGSCDYLRRMNEHLQDVRPKRYRAAVVGLSRSVLVKRRGEESRPELDLRGARFARTRNQALRDAVAGYRLSGSLDDLPVPADLGAYRRSVAGVDPGEVGAAGLAVWHHLAEGLGVDGVPPGDLDALVADNARMLRRLKGWDR
jgi:hypothetical protein